MTLDSPAPTSPDGADLAGLTFEALMARLDALSSSLDDPSIGLGEAVARYEAAADLARHALDRLQKAEARVQHLQLQ